MLTVTVDLWPDEEERGLMVSTEQKAFDQCKQESNHSRGYIQATYIVLYVFEWVRAAKDKRSL